jgi:serine/threonine-protein kinase
VKRLKREAAEGASAALLAEAQATGAVEHPNVVPVHALGSDDAGAPLLVMKRIEGESLDLLVREPSHPSWPALERRHGDRLGAIVEILGHVADALHFAHTRGLLHRDVKPENVMVGRYGEVYLVDWGIALRRDAPPEERGGFSVVGTPAFMAPEMVRGPASSLDARTDVYLLGATLHAAITGRPRHEGPTLVGVLGAALVSEPVAYPPELAEIGALANRATSADRAARPGSALEFREALAAFRRHRGALRLVEEAEARLAELGSRPDLLGPEALRALTESRFALTLALREHPGHPEARRALDQTLRQMIDAELLRRSPDGAEALAAELSAVDPAIDARVAAVRAEVAEARRLEALARREEHERDPRRTAKQQAWLASALIVVSAVLVALGWTSEAAHAGGARPMGEALAYDGVLLACALAMLAGLRRSLFANRRGRQVAAVLLALLALGAASDVIFLLRDADPRQAGASSLLAMGSVLTGAGLSSDRRFLITAAFFFAGAATAALVPALTVPSIGAAAIGGGLVLLASALAHLRAPR